ncbi:MAG TPA: methyltransferase domain-containing protein [Methanocella sp.]|nr:methyltransferase domain-containing protein [Methanocella sp.]
MKGGKAAIDFGCGTGRSTRFLRRIGFDVVGVDIAGDMIRMAKGLDPGGDYRLIDDGDLGQFGAGAYDLVLSVFTFDNVPTMGRKVRLFKKLGALMKGSGRLVNLVSSPEIYKNEWASFTTKDFPENRLARSGDKVRIIMTDVEDRRPVEDIIWYDEDYRKVFRKAGLEPVKAYAPLARCEEPYPWVNETRIAPWVIYVLKRNDL